MPLAISSEGVDDVVNQDPLEGKGEPYPSVNIIPSCKRAGSREFCRRGVRV